MEIRQAVIDDLSVIKSIVSETINKVYPKYYPKGVVYFFLSHHSEKNIEWNISRNKVFVILEGHTFIGAVTIVDNTIAGLYVLSEYQGKGYGSALLDFAERRIFCEYDVIQLDASLPAKKLYLKRGYRDSEYYVVPTDDGDYLCYDVMIKEVVAKNKIE